jgi:hypothetical protein
MMKLTLPPLQVKDDEGFSLSDIFELKDFGSRLANLIENSNENLVLALDAQWGEGKSTFIKMWKGYLENYREKKLKTIYFDAFKNDYQKDPFLALAAEIYELIKKESVANRNQFKKKASKAIKSLARGALKIGLRAATAGALDGSIVDDIKEDIADLTADEADKLIADRLLNSSKDKSALEDFKQYLADLALKQGDGNPIVFIIDELDRCRPDFALELIEQIKHLFSVKGIVFLLVLSRKQLEASVNNRYGTEVNAAIYLHKFINLWLSLPRRTGQSDHGSKYFKYSINQMLEDDEKIQNDIAKQTLEDLIKINRPSYREIEHILSYFALLHNMIGKEKYRASYQLLIAFICYIKSVKPYLIESIKKQSLTADKLLEETGLDKSSADDPHTIRDLISYIKFDLASDSIRKAMIANKELIDYDYGRGLPNNSMSRICEWLAEINLDR